MTIPLNINQTNANMQQKMAHFEKIILAVKAGDWNAKELLANEFMPLLTSLAERRSKEKAVINTLIEAGKKGLFKAAQKYVHKIHPEKFRIFALTFIEKEMDNALTGKKGFFSRIFG